MDDRVNDWLDVKPIPLWSEGLGEKPVIGKVTVKSYPPDAPQLRLDPSLSIGKTPRECWFEFNGKWTPGWWHQWAVVGTVNDGDGAEPCAVVEDLEGRTFTIGSHKLQFGDLNGRRWHQSAIQLTEEITESDRAQPQPPYPAPAPPVSEDVERIEKIGAMMLHDDFMIEFYSGDLFDRGTEPDPNRAGFVRKVRGRLEKPVVAIELIPIGEFGDTNATVSRNYLISQDSAELFRARLNTAIEKAWGPSTKAIPDPADAFWTIDRHGDFPNIAGVPLCDYLHEFQLLINDLRGSVREHENGILADESLRFRFRDRVLTFKRTIEQLAKLARDPKS